MAQVIGVPRETAAGEKRVATVPEIVQKLVKLGFKQADHTFGPPLEMRSRWQLFATHKNEKNTTRFYFLKSSPEIVLVTLRQHGATYPFLCI